MNEQPIPPWDNKIRLVVCAAIRSGSRIICGVRHYDDIMRTQLRLTGETGRAWDEGFVDQFGVFMEREEAHAVATKAGQIRFRCGGDRTALFSENLY